MIHFVIPYSFEQRLFDAYNQEFNRLASPDDWLVICDGDVAFLNANFGHQIKDYIDMYPDTGLFTCYASRSHYKYMIPKDGNDQSPDIIFHKKVANAHAQNLHLAVKPIDGNITGHIMVIKKATWLKIRNKVAARTRFETIEAIDTAIGKVLHELNLPILLMRGIYVFHYCRLAEGYKFRAHLGYNNFFNIITPSVRPDNLSRIAESINIPKRMFRWVVVIDGSRPAVVPQFPRHAEVYYYHDKNSKSGNGQRNLALDIIMGNLSPDTLRKLSATGSDATAKAASANNFEQYVYFLDDDTLMHPDFYLSVKDLPDDLIHFNQQNPDGSHRIGGHVKLNQVDSGNVVIKKSLIGAVRWQLDKYNADGFFMEAMLQKAQSPLYLNKTLSTYNAIH